MGNNSLYFNRSRVIPNLNGVFYVTALKTSSSNVGLDTRNVIGAFNPAGELLANMGGSSSDPDIDIKVVKIKDSLNNVERSEVRKMLNEYKDIFSSNSLCYAVTQPFGLNH